jgi:hypothetical protein
VGERTTDMRSIEFEMSARVAAFRKFAPHAPAAAGDDDAAHADATAASSSAPKSKVERYYFTFETIDARRSCWDALHKLCARVGESEAAATATAAITSTASASSHTSHALTAAAQSDPTAALPPLSDDESAALTRAARRRSTLPDAEDEQV